MKFYHLKQLSPEEYRLLLRRSETDITKHLSLAAEVIDRVREEGDAAVLHYTEKFDGISLKEKGLRVKKEEIEEAYGRTDQKIRDTLEYAAANIKKFHREQLPAEMWLKEIEDGLLAGEKITPIADVCLYVPRGKGSFPSVMLMLGTPAVVAGVPRIAVCTPPGPAGDVDAATLAVAHILGIEEIYRVGGIQALAAVAFGTGSIPRCRKVIGPGNAYVSAAKRILYGVLDVGLPAGPSEAVILADEFADVQTVALDLLIEAEHGPDSASLLVTHSWELANKVARVIPGYIDKLPAEKAAFVRQVFQNYGGVVITENLEDSIKFVNDYAPEHLEVLIADPFALLTRIKNTGEMLLGPCTPITFGNFLLGPNAILPTGSFAKTFSGVSVHDFLKRSSLGYVTREGFARVREKAIHFAEVEGFSAHAMAVRERKI